MRKSTRSSAYIPTRSCLIQFSVKYLKMASNNFVHQELANYARHAHLIIYIGSEVLRFVLRTKIPFKGLNAFLSQKEHLFRRLKHDQRQFLYPPGCVFAVTIDDLEFSLLYVLRQFQGRMPNDSDRSLAANIDRLRVYRDDFAHLRTAPVSDEYFNGRWENIHQCILEIEQSTLGGNVYMPAMDNLLTRALLYINQKKLELEFREKEQQQREFTAGISENEDRPCNITVTVVGHKGVGKSCFVRQIMEQYIPEGGPGSTDTADLYVNYFAFNPNTGFRKELGENGEAETGRQRLKRIIDRYRKGENTDIQTEPATVVASVSMSPSRSSSTEITGVQQKQTSHANPSHSEEIKRAKLSSEHRNVIKEIMHTEIEEKDEQLKDLITIYDFGGEKVFYNTHHCFMSSNMIFVLVFNVAMCLDSNKSEDGYESIKNWLRSIATYAIDQAACGKGTPPVIIVGSFLDEVSSDEEKQKEAFTAVLEELYKNPQLREIMETHVQEMYCIANLNDSSKNRNVFDLIWNKIIEVAPLQSQWKKPVPAKWMALEHYIVKRKNTGGMILTYEELLEINRESAVPLAEHEILDFIKNLRLVGPFLCFELHGKSPFIVLNLQWMVDAFKAIITAPNFTTGLSMKLQIEWKQYEKSGVIKIDFIRQLWKRHKDNSFLSNFKTLHSVMETLGLLAKPLSDKEEVEYFIVPCMLQTADPEIIRPVLDDPETVITVTLCLKFDNPFIPQAVWDKMIAACIQNFRPLNERGHDGSKFIQRSFVCRSVNSLWNMIVNCSENVMKITMFKKDTDKSVPTGTGVKPLRELEVCINRILELNHQSHLKYQFYLHNDYRFTADDKMVKVDDLRQTPRLQCHSSNDSRWIERKDFHTWFEYQDHENPVNETRIKEIHAKMIRNLSNWIDPRLPDYWRIVQASMECYLSTIDIYGTDVNCFNDICRALMRNGTIHYGKYDKLRSVAAEIHVDAAKIIDNAMVEINGI